jgi:hypothetical protein
MKKITKKLAIFILTSFLINIFILGSTVLATESSSYKEAKDAITNLTNCEDSSAYKNANVAIKFYEPMLEAEEVKEKLNALNAEILDCYEHTLENDPSNDAIEKFTISRLSDQECNSVTAPDGTIHSCKWIQILLSDSGTAVMYTYIGYIYKWASTIVGLIAVMVMIFSGIQIATSGGDTEVLSSAKSRIIKSLSGIAVLFLSGLILYTINPTFFTYT